MYHLVSTNSTRGFSFALAELAELAEVAELADPAELRSFGLLGSLGLLDLATGGFSFFKVARLLGFKPDAIDSPLLSSEKTPDIPPPVLVPVVLGVLVVLVRLAVNWSTDGGGGGGGGAPPLAELVELVGLAELAELADPVDPGLEFHSNPSGQVSATSFFSPSR